MHKDDVNFSDDVRRWLDNPENKDKKVPGDDRVPAWTWMGGLHHDDKVVVIPQEAIRGVLKEAGAQVPVPKAKRGLTFKSLTQSGITVVEDFTLLIKGKPVSLDSLRPLLEEEDLSKHTKTVGELGFYLDVRPCKVNGKRHVRVRARFDQWSASGVLEVDDDLITEEKLGEILHIAGVKKGLLDWRPGAKQSPGPFGKFLPKLKRVK